MNNLTWQINSMLNKGINQGQVIVSFEGIKLNTCLYYFLIFSGGKNAFCCTLYMKKKKKFQIIAFKVITSKSDHLRWYVIRCLCKYII